MLMIFVDYVARPNVFFRQQKTEWLKISDLIVWGKLGRGGGRGSLSNYGFYKREPVDMDSSIRESSSKREPVDMD